MEFWSLPRILTLKSQEHKVASALGQLIVISEQILVILTLDER
jgi:hypothetical protein